MVSLNPDEHSTSGCNIDIEADISKFQYRPRKIFSRYGEQFGGIRVPSRSLASTASTTEGLASVHGRKTAALMAHMYLHH